MTKLFIISVDYKDFGRKRKHKDDRECIGEEK
jgi:hypothetical protein